jgi:antitoxin FitA
MHSMSRTLQIRDVSEELHTAVRTKAAQADLSVSDYLRNLLTEIATKPSMAEIVERAKMLARTGGGASRSDIQAVIREGRDG